MHKHKLVQRARGIIYVAILFVVLYLTYYYLTQRNTNVVSTKNYMLLFNRIVQLEDEIVKYKIANDEDGGADGDTNIQVKTVIDKSPSKKIDVKDFTTASDNNKIIVVPNVGTKRIYKKELSEYESCYNEVLTNRFNDVTVSDINREELEECNIKQHCLHDNPKQCPSPVLLGPLSVRTDRNSTNYDLNFVRHGGWWCPINCTEKQTVIILIPFRQREEHLPVLLNNLHPILKRQQLHYRVFVVEQDDNDSFNKGKLINAGFKEIQKLFPYSCIVFQDVDLVPEDDRVDYACKHSPMHLAGVIDKYGYTLHSPNAFGGVVSFATKDYVKINGFSNLFWVWGGEDDDLYQRVVRHNMKSTRESLKIARYKMLKHVNRMHSRTNKDHLESLKTMKKSAEHADADGLNSVTYKVTQIMKKRLYTLIKIDLLKANLELS